MTSRGGSTDKRSETQPPSEPSDSGRESLPLAAIQAAIVGIRHGVVQIIIQDGRVVQIDKTEKIRFV